MEFKDVIYGRRSVRSFEPKAIDDEILTEIIDAGLWAPSGVNLQPWYFVVIRSAEQLSRYKEYMAKVAEKNKAHLEKRFSDHPDVVSSTLSFMETLGDAPAVVLAFRDKPDYSYALQDEGIVESVGAAMENIVLSAYDHGIASCWMTAPVQANMTAAIRDEFAPGHGELVCMAVLGYAKKIPDAPKRKGNKFVLI